MQYDKGNPSKLPVLFVLFDSPQMGNIMTPGNIAVAEKSKIFVLVYLHPKWWWTSIAMFVNTGVYTGGWNKN